MTEATDPADRIFPFPRPSPEEVRNAIERMEEEREVTGAVCPYCGLRGMSGPHRYRHHPEMWIGGSNTWGSELHGWADH